MNRFCPNYRNKTVFDKFNQMIQALGGKPMTEEEFRSSELRMQRTGSDFAAMEAAYKIYELNNGNFLDEAPNGNPSILYTQLLQLTNGNVNEALRLKADIFSNAFEKMHGTWISEDESKINTKLKLDINGEPLLSNFVEDKISSSETNKFKVVSTALLFGKQSSDQLSSGLFVSSKDCISNMLSVKIIDSTNIALADVLSKHDIPVVYQTLTDGSMMKTVYDNDKGCIIVIDPQRLSQVSNRYAANVFLHEVVHAVTTNAIVNPKSNYERDFQTKNNKLFTIYDKIYSQNRYTREGIFYGLTNEREFAAEFITNSDFRNMLYIKARELDSQSNGRFGKIFKNVINAVSSIFVNKTLFKDNVQQLKDYEQKFRDYLHGVSKIQYGNLPTKSKLLQLYKTINDNTLSNEQRNEYLKQLNTTIQNLQQDNFIHIGSDIKYTAQQEDERRLQKLATDCAGFLTLRLKAVTSSNLPSAFKSKHEQILETQINAFQQGINGIYLAISSLLTQAAPQLMDDCKKLKKIYEEGDFIGEDMYMYQMHDNFGTYDRLFNEIYAILETPTIRNIISEQAKGTNEQKLESIEQLRSIVKKCSDVTRDGTICLRQLLIRNVRNTLTNMGMDSHDVTMQAYLEQLVDTRHDTNVFFRYLGSVDKANDNGLRVLAHLVNDALHKSDRQTYEKSVDLLQLQKNLKLGESVKDLYEHDNNGITTGYIVRDLNFGQFEQDYNKFLEKLNKRISKKYGILLEPNNRRAPDNDEESRKEWLSLQNEWLDKHCERRFKKEYYDYYNQMSAVTRDARSKIQQQIDVIKSECLGDDGFYHFERLTEESYSTLQQLYVQKRLLASDRDLNGNLKEEGSTEWQIAKELQELNKKIRPSAGEIAKNVEAWRNAREAVIKEAGGEDEYEKYLNREPSKFDAKKLHEWDLYNTKKQFKRDKDGKVLLFKHIDEEIGEEIVYEVDGDGGAQYNALKEQQQEIFNNYRNYNTGDVMWSRVPRQLRTKLALIDGQMRGLRKRAINQNKKLKSLVDKRRALYEKYVDSVETETYKEMRIAAENMANETGDFGSFEDFIDMTHYQSVDEFGTPYGKAILKKQFSRLVAKPEYEDEYMELVPGNGYMESDKNNSFLNEKFNDLKKYNKKWVPKRELYDNSKNYNKIQNSKTLKALYDGVLSAMDEANACFTNRTNFDRYLLPQITGSFYKRLKNQRGKWRQILDYIKDGIGYGEQGILQDYEFGKDSTNSLAQLDETGIEIGNRIADQDILLSGIRPDGHSLNLIPQYYTKKLENPGQLSADLIGIVCEYYNKAMQYDNKHKIQSTCESILDMMENRRVEKRTGITFKKTQISGKESNTYKTAKKFLEMNLYNKRQNLGSHEFELFGKKRSFNHGKIVQAIRAFVTAVNLGCSPVVAAVGMFSTSVAHITQAITGQHYGKREALASGMQLLYDLTTTSPSTLVGTVIGGMMMNPLLGVPVGMLIGSLIDRNILRRGIIQNRFSNNLSVARMEMYNIGGQGQRKYKNSNRWEAINSINDNWCYGMLTFTDFITKSQIMNSTLMSYRYYKGEFTTLEDLKINYINKPYSEYKAAVKEWRKGVSVFSLQEIRDGKIQIKDKYKQYESAYKAIEDILHSRIEKYCESADGMQTSIQKSAITQNALGGLVMMHRQYLPVMLQERMGMSSWDYDTQQMNGGVYRCAFGSAKAFVSAAWCAAIDAFTHLSLTKAHDTFNQKYFGKDLSPEEVLKKQYALYKLKQIGIELALVQGMIPFMIYLLEAYTDKKDKRRDHILKMLTYIAYRGLWESKTPYLFSDLANNIKTVTAATSVTDKVQNLIESSTRTYLPWTNNLWDTFLDKHTKKYETKVKRGSYKGWYKTDRDLFKLTPMHNAYEQYYGSDDKLRYFKNQVMKID